ncbi:LOW QUALITY PROTEIN: nuclear receptor-binding protein homolog [Danaus plexippus]|uniref:LOW QUALITY PROTEIN: nuclear receptor-binding protein homolog n=1 Tax=Danaus plexippus TaxID=13037 RepID=UPI002AB188C2|nr:LOW QUALITY PROTEIN: nuclear receptor-binding protein homolog [Danaus plexippus]
MSGGRSIDKERKSPRESGEDSEDESEILEESPCGRWLKRREEVEQRDVPGIDCAHLAMDTEEGVEVVWNEVQFSERKNFKAQEDKIQMVFDNLTRLEHPNIVKFHRYWTDTHNDKPRVIFITEYMSCGSLKQFLKRTKRNVKRLPLQAWKRWCTQILSALSYLHGCVPPIVHGNLTCDTIFIQHNGLVKIGSVAPDAIHHHVKTCRENMRNMHLIAPEYGSSQMVTPAMDIYSFGMCALETAALEIQGNGETGSHVTDEHVIRTVESLEETRQKDFIYRCINKDPSKRPTARELLFHPLLFEVHSLKLLAAHTLVNTCANISETITDEMSSGGGVAAWSSRGGARSELAARDLPHAEKLEKFVEDVKYGIYPLTAYGSSVRSSSPCERARAASESAPASPEPREGLETRRVVNMMCSLKPAPAAAPAAPAPAHTHDLLMTILLRMDDKMNRQLTCAVTRRDSAAALAAELVALGFIHEADRDKICRLMEDSLRGSFGQRVTHVAS